MYDFGDLYFVLIGECIGKYYCCMVFWIEFGDVVCLCFGCCFDV